MKTTHYIKKHETLKSIATKYGIAEELLKRENNLENEDISKLTQISIPDINNDFEVIKNLDKELVYEIQKDDEYLKENKAIIQSLGNNHFVPGDKILINYNFKNRYIVKPLDTIYTIANKYNIDVEVIMDSNSLKSPKLYVGQVLTF